MQIAHYAPESTHEGERPSTAWSLVARLARHRLVHFVLLGGALFLLAPRQGDRDVIRVTTAERSALYAAEARRLGAATLTARERDEIDRRALEDEILSREAVRLGLDKSDGVVRQRLVQRALFLAEDIGGASDAPTDAELRRYYEQTRDRWTRGGRLHFVHVYLAGADAEKIRATAAALPPAFDSAPALGDAFPLPRDARLTDEQTAAAYGDAFARAVAALPHRQWSAPIASKYGTHFVALVERDDGRPATFEEALGELRLAYVVARKKRAVADFVDKACARYTLDFDGEPTTCGASGRTAVARREGWD